VKAINGKSMPPTPLSGSPTKSLNPVKTLRLQSPLAAAAPSLIGERTDEATPLYDLSQLSKSLGLHDLISDAPIEKAPAPAKESQFASLVSPVHKQIFPPLNLTVGKNPRYTFQSSRRNQNQNQTIK